MHRCWGSRFSTAQRSSNANLVGAAQFSVTLIIRTPRPAYRTRVDALASALPATAGVAPDRVLKPRAYGGDRLRIRCRDRAQGPTLVRTVIRIAHG
jgi:hypothetical protein